MLFKNEVNTIPFGAFHAAQGGSRVILLAQLRLCPFDGNPVIPLKRLHPPLILMGPSRKNFLADYRLANHLLEEINHLTRPG